MITLDNASRVHRICRKLQEQLKTQQAKVSVLHQQVGLEHGLSPSSSGTGRLQAMNGSRQQSYALVPYGTNQSHGHIPHSVCAPHQQLLQQHAHNTGAAALQHSPARHALTRTMPQSHRSGSARAASPTLGAAPTPSDGNATSLSGGSGVSALLQGSRAKTALASDPMNARRRSSAPSRSGGSLSDLIKSRKR